MAKQMIPIGTRFGRLVVIGTPKPPTRRNGLALVRCDCGKEKSVGNSDLRNGCAKSCGCLQRELARKRVLTHGQTGTRMYRVWQSMHSRCYPTAPCFRNYFARGIMVCKRWKKYEAFARDMGECPPGMSLDRINNNMGYSPSNCRWASRKQQARNKQTNRIISAWGESKTLADWCDDPRCNVYQARLGQRLAAGWGPENAISLPPERRSRLTR